MGDIGVPELLIILAIAIAVFGTSKLAGAGKAVGTSIREFKRAIRDDESPAAEVETERRVEPRVVERVEPRPVVAAETTERAEPETKAA